jgi:hypothetical protein
MSPDVFHLLNKKRGVVVLNLIVCVYYLSLVVSNLMMSMIASDDSSDGALSSSHAYTTHVDDS